MILMYIILILQFILAVSLASALNQAIAERDRALRDLDEYKQAIVAYIQDNGARYRASIPKDEER